MKRVNAESPTGRSVTPRTEDGGWPQNNPVCAGRLPPEMHRELVGRHVDPEAIDAVDAFVNEGILPTTASDADDVAGWCLEQGLTRHFAAVPASELTIWPTMNLETVATALNGAWSLRELTFQTLAIDVDAAHTITALLRTLPSLEDLGFVECNISDAGLKVLSQALRPGLRTFGVDCVDVSHAMDALAPALRDSSLETVDFVFASIGNDELRTLCAALAQNKTLQSLHLVGNVFDDGTPLAALLRTQTSLRELHLVRCKAETTLPVLAVLQENTCRPRSLTMRALDFEAISEEQWHVSVANMLGVNNTLSTLDMLNNDMSAISVERIGYALEKNFSLQNLALGPTRSVLPASSIDTFIESLKRNFGLTDIFVVPHLLTQNQSDAILAQTLSNKNRAVACSMGFMHGAGMAFAAAIPRQLHGEAGERIAEHVLKTSTVKEFRAAGGPAALARINRSANDAAVRQRSLEYRNEILHWLNEGDHEGISDLCRELESAGVTILPEHMDGLLATADKIPGRPAALLDHFRRVGQGSISQGALEPLQKQAADSTTMP